MSEEILSKDPLTLKGKERDEWLATKQSSIMEQVRNYKDSPEDLKELMSFMTQFHNYSFRNLMLIQSQWRGAYAVASYDRWKKLGYPVKKKEDGGKGRILIWVPVLVKLIKLDNGTKVNWMRATAEQKRRANSGELEVNKIRRFRSGFVYDITQTHAKPEDYPKIFPNRHYDFNDDDLNYDNVLRGIDAVASEIGTEIFWDEEQVLGNAKGAYFHESHRILLNPLNTPAEVVATSIHELAHAHMHRFRDMPSRIKELQAELASTLVSSAFGLDTLEKAVGYISSHLNRGVTPVNKDTKDASNLDSVLIETQETVKLFIRIIKKEFEDEGM